MMKMPQIKKTKKFLNQLAGYRMVFPQVSGLLRSIPGVFGTWIGMKMVNGKHTDQLCIAALVHDKKPHKSLPQKAIVPGEITLQSDAGRVKVVTDVLEARIPRFLGRRDTELPATGGDSASLNDPNLYYGTVGFAAKKNSNDAPGFISAFHVFTAPNSPDFDPPPKLIKGGDTVVKPAAFYSVSDDDTILLGSSIGPTRPKEFVPEKSYKSDIAFIEVDTPDQIEDTIRDLAWEWDHLSVGSPKDLYFGQTVKYSGATSEQMTGSYRFDMGDLPVIFYEPVSGISPMTPVIANNVFGFSLESASGDSGSLILTQKDGKTIGVSLVMAKTEVRAEDNQWEAVTLGFSLKSMLKDFGSRPWNAEPPPPPTPEEEDDRPDPWDSAIAVMGMGVDDPVNESLEAARSRIRDSDLGPAINGWYEELKTEDLASLFLTNEKFSTQAGELLAIGRRVIQDGGRLTAKDLGHIGTVFETLEEAGTPAPKHLLPEIMNRLKGAVGKSWPGVVDALCGKKPRKK